VYVDNCTQNKIKQAAALFYEALLSRREKTMSQKVRHGLSFCAGPYRKIRGNIIMCIAGLNRKDFYKGCFF